MIETKEQLKVCLEYENQIYTQYMFPTKMKYILFRIIREQTRMIYSFLRLSRKADYYKFKKKEGSWVNHFLYLFYLFRKNRLGEKLGLEVGTNHIKEGFLMYHYNNVVNANSVIGKNLHLYGNNCIGNDGKTNDCPVIGNNVSLGVGAKVIGNITIADNIKIGAGAIVIHSFLEEGITIGGVPARKLK